MGDCKDNMKKKVVTQDLDDSPAKKVLGVFKSRKHKKVDAQDTASTFADMIEQADERLNVLIFKKEAELDQEEGDEVYNRQALALLKSMSFHINEIVAAAETYSELKRS